MPDKYSIILPTYEERDNIPLIMWLIFEEAKNSNLDIEVIVVEDNSPDGTLAVVEELKKIYGDKIIIHARAGKLGLGTAYMEGLELCTGNYVFLMDADMSHHPKFIPQFISVMAESKCDIVTGTRYKSGGGVYGWDLYRKLTSRVANYIAKFMFNPDKGSDLTGSFRLYKKEVLSAIMKDMVSKGYVF